MSKNKILDAIIGDLDKWKRMPEEFKKLSEDMKDSKKAWKLALTFGISFLLILGFMYGISLIQNNAQYCEINIDGNELGSIQGSNVKLDIPKNNMSYQYYLDFYEGKNIPTWLDMNCKMDFRRLFK